MGVIRPGRENISAWGPDVSGTPHRDVSRAVGEKLRQTWRLSKLWPPPRLRFFGGLV